ncbi:hypothetical protein [Paenarthrobacter sp. CAP02]|uniref:hypothetical protein n=1 Tax=Paenarthrobacter sp. CAP02 TaxID=3158144 RepID=UPI0032DA7DE0
MTESAGPFRGRSKEEYERLLLAKLQPAAIRSTLSFAGLYQMTHEMLKQVIPQRVRDFYCTGFSEKGTVLDEHAYQEHVIDAARTEGWVKDSRQTFEASAAWLVRMEAITPFQAKRLQAIYGHRHELTHELASFIVDPDRNLDAQMFVDAVAILRDVHRFWVSVERDIGMFEHLGDVALDEVTPLSLLLLQQCIDAYLEGETEPENV